MKLVPTWHFVRIRIQELREAVLAYEEPSGNLFPQFEASGLSVSSAHSPPVAGSVVPESLLWKLRLPGFRARLPRDRIMNVESVRIENA